MIRLNVTKEMIDSARAKANALGSINNSILKGAGNVAGYLGEEVVASYVKAEVVSNNRGLEKYNHDLLLSGGCRIEVKTKRRTVSPRGYYDVSVARTSKHQQPDTYAFVSLEFERVTHSHPKKYYGLINAWLCGFMPANEYWKRAKLWKSGQIDKTNNFKTHVDMYNLAIEDLYQEIPEYII
jgi:hypothetical protein|tara:strand:- start:16978 stop:17523 length:546 start_codon:yes stop_codon:yes gene_type:complete